jgi:hypothetical protein
LQTSGGGSKPIYVGKTAAGKFRGACFKDGNFRKLHRGLEGETGRLVLFLIRYEEERRAGRRNESVIGAMEAHLITVAYARNPNLINKQGTRRKWQLRIKGVINPGQGKPPKGAAPLRKTLGLDG